MMKKQRKARLAISFFSCFLLSACAGQPEMYHWGNYQSLVYDMYIEPGKADTLSQIEKLNADIDQASSKGKRVAPGIYAHLGFMQALLGNTEKSIQSFETEKTLYPESSVFIDGILTRSSSTKNGAVNETAK